MGEEKNIDQSQFRETFAREAKVRLVRLNGGLVYFEKNPGDKKLEGDILREAHALKDAARVLGFSKISDLSQKFEEALTRRRDKAILANQDLTDALFVTLDTLSRLVDALFQPPRELIDVEPVLDRLKLAQVSAGAPGAREVPAPEIATPPAISPMTRSPVSISPHSGYDDLGTGTCVDTARLESISDLLANAASHHRQELELRERLGEFESFYRRTAAALLAAVQDGLAQGEFSPAFTRRVASLVAEGKTGFQEDGIQGSELKRRESVVIAALSQNLEELRSEVMALRTVPLFPLFASFHPMAGALARELGKDVEVQIRGGRTEIDRKVAEALAEPLTHILRNAIDHGIEAPAERERAGKPRKGRIVITATPKKGRVVLEVEDDGRGIDPNEVREVAIRKGMISEEAALRMDDQELIHFVFHTGFSTSKRMTGISGPGIGMDVVRATAERFNGTTEVHSDPGKGTRVIMEFPMNPVAGVPSR